MKKIILIDIDYYNGGHNKVYADSIVEGIRDFQVLIDKTNLKHTKASLIKYIIKVFLNRDVHIHFLYVDPLLKYMSVLFPILFFLKKINNITVTCTYHVYNEQKLINFITRFLDGIVVHSDWVLPSLNHQSKVDVIYYPSFLNPSFIRKKSPKNIRFGFLGGNRPEKRYDLFIDAMNKCPHDVEVVAAGTNTDLEANQLILNKPAKIISRHLTDDELKALIEYIDVIVLPYENTFKGQSGPLIEAAYASKVVVCSDAPILKETVLRYHLGEVFESGNIDDLSVKIEKVITNYDDYNKKNDFKHEYSKERFLKGYIEFFKRI